LCSGGNWFSQVTKHQQDFIVVSKITINRLKTKAEPTPELLHVPNISQTMDNAQHNIGIIKQECYPNQLKNSWYFKHIKVEGIRSDLSTACSYLTNNLQYKTDSMENEEILTAP
jgi:hypothetical protein